MTAAIGGALLLLAAGCGPGLAQAGQMPPDVLARSWIAQVSSGLAGMQLAQAPASAGRKAEATPPADPRLPRIELSRQVMFQYLLAEISVQRGRYDVAMAALNDLAKSTRDPRIAARATEVALRAGAYKQAVEAAGIWVSIDPDSIQARQTVVALLVNGGQLNAAIPHLERLLVNEGNNIGGGFLQLASLFAKQPDRAVVLGVVRSLAAKHLGLREARLAVAQAAWTAQDFDLSLSEVREAQRISPDWELAALFETQILARRSNAEAAAQLQKFVEANPKATEARMNLARLYAAEQRLPEARREFERLAADFPENAELGLAIGLLSLQLGDFDTADQKLRKLLAAQPKDPDMLRYYLGRTAEGRKQMGDAVKWYRAVEAGPQRVAAQLAEASVLARQGSTKEAREVLRQIVPSSLDQRVQLVLTEAQVLRDAKDFQGAFELLGEALAKTPDTPDLLYDQALVAERLGKFDITEKNLVRVIEIRPDHAHAHNALGYTLADRNVRLDEALKLIETALRLAPEDPYILDSMGWVFFRMGHPQKALDFLQRAYKIKRDAEIAAHLGEVLWSEGRRDEAQRIWDEALKSSPGNEVLQGTVKRLRK
ncbi:MAG: tetratricopeptide repeat protein [Burkholderiales bacterium]|nr:tetratricopeptide repeat protein [Burkholderiales bacterium]